MKYEKIAEHEDWKDGHDAFRTWTVNKIQALEWEIKELKNGTNKPKGKES